MVVFDQLGFVPELLGLPGIQFCACLSFGLRLCETFVPFYPLADQTDAVGLTVRPEHIARSISISSGSARPFI